MNFLFNGGDKFVSDRWKDYQFDQKELFQHIEADLIHVLSNLMVFPCLDCHNFCQQHCRFHEKRTTDQP